MPKPLVSIITPTYNQERYVAQCLRSTLAQTYEHWEQIVVDDGSDDRTVEVVESIGDPRIRCVRLPHRGLAALGETYNTALAEARGELVAVLEGDDAWPAHKLEAQLPVFDAPDVFLSWGRATVIDEADRPVRRISTVATGDPVSYLSNEEVFARLTRMNLLAPAASVMVRRSALDAIGGFQQAGSSLYVDLPTWIWLAARTRGRVAFVNRELARYRVHGQQTTRRFRQKMDAEHLQIVLELVRRLDDARLRELGWPELERGARTAGLLAEGLGFLGKEDYGAARSAFARALREAGSWRDRVKASIGIVSGVVHADLVSATFALRESVLSARPERAPDGRAATPTRG